MLRLFPKESGAHKRERSIPFLPQGESPVPLHKTEIVCTLQKMIKLHSFELNGLKWSLLKLVN